jgi:uncharacterized membrane protein YgdD (TMEM256/DUF423 family)
MRALIVAAAASGLLLVVVGAATGHNSAPPPGDPDLYISSWIRDTERQDLLNTILLFGFAHILAAIGTVALPLRGLLVRLSGWSFLAGVVMFSGGLTARLVLGEDGGATSAITMFVPIGGIAFMVGWMLLIAAALMKRREA